MCLHKISGWLFFYRMILSFWHLIQTFIVLRFLQDKQSYGYQEFRQLVEKLRSNPLRSNPIKVEQSEYEESSEYCGIVIKKEALSENSLKRESDGMFFIFEINIATKFHLKFEENRGSLVVWEWLENDILY